MNVDSNLDLKPAAPSSDAKHPAVDDSTSVQTSEYQAAIDYLYGRINFEKSVQTKYTDQHYRLDRMRELLRRLGNPQDLYSIVHIAGTKGKGTVANLVADGLNANNLRTGLYTSPHLNRLEERFNIGGELASEAELVELVSQVRIVSDEMAETAFGSPTFFELTTALGMLHFARRQCELAVIEVGLGGRLDSTNVCSPVVSVITSISLDHQKILGDTIEEIAGEKAGIIKHGVPVIASATDEAARKVFVDTCSSKSAPLKMLGREFECAWQLQNNVASVQFGIADGEDENQDWNNTVWKTSLLGRHQAENVAAAIATLCELKSQGFQIDLDKSREAISNCSPPGRMQIICNKPPVIIDTAHNTASISAGLNALSSHYPEHRKVVLFATSSDKDSEGMLDDLLANSSVLVITEYLKNPRALKLERLQALISSRTVESSCQVLFAESPATGLALAKEQLDEHALLYCAGSFFLAAELLELQTN